VAWEGEGEGNRIVGRVGWEDTQGEGFLGGGWWVFHSEGNNNKLIVNVVYSSEFHKTKKSLKLNISIKFLKLLKTLPINNPPSLIFYNTYIHFNFDFSFKWAWTT
jgi:hypothetical protein